MTRSATQEVFLSWAFFYKDFPTGYTQLVNQDAEKADDQDHPQNGTKIEKSGMRFCQCEHEVEIEGLD